MQTVRHLWSNIWGNWWKTVLELNFILILTNFSKVKKLMEMRSSSEVKGTPPRASAQYRKNARWHFSGNMKINLFRRHIKLGVWSALKIFARISFLFTHDLVKPLQVLEKIIREKFCELHTQYFDIQFSVKWFFLFLTSLPPWWRFYNTQLLQLLI